MTSRLAKELFVASLVVGDSSGMERWGGGGHGGVGAGWGRWGHSGVTTVHRIVLFTEMEIAAPPGFSDNWC